jgi:hypothetical protein
MTTGTEFKPMHHAYTESKVLDMYHVWNIRPDGKIAGIRFGQWCCNNYPDLHQNQWLWNETDNRKTLQTMILVARGVEK